MKKARVDTLMLASILALVALGLLMVFSAGSYTAQSEGESALSPLVSQLIPMGLGIALMIILSKLDYYTYRNGPLVLMVLIISFALLILVFVPGIGVSINNSRRWIKIPGVPMTIQPGEIAKFALALFGANVLSRKYNPDDIKEFALKVAAPILGVAGIMFLLVMEQPNLSTGGSILILAAGMIFVGGMRLRWFSLLGLVGVVVAAIYIFGSDYRRERLLYFTDPWTYAGDETYQLAQSLLAVASGGLFGMGLGQSRQKLLFLPYCESDFIFAIVCEELGFVGVLGVLALFGLLIFTGFRTAFRCKERFGSLLAASITLVIALQVILHMMVVTGLFPTTGLPLPFFSAGGTNAAVFTGGCGILLNISRYAKAPEKTVDRETLLQPEDSNIRPFHRRA